jgi:hypothetical protein
MADLGLTQQQISAVKGISLATLTKYYAIELETGESALNAGSIRVPGVTDDQSAWWRSVLNLIHRFGRIAARSVSVHDR